MPHVNTSSLINKSAGDVISVVVEELGWKEIKTAPRLPREKTIHYVMQNTEFYDRFDLVHRSRDAWISRYPGMPELCSKVVFAEMLEAFICLFPEKRKTLFGFWPTTWILPTQAEDLKKWLVRKRTCIIKPEDGSQGDGIFLVMTPRDVEVKLMARAMSGGKFVGQQYVQNPLLIGGKKFDVRIYAICKSIGDSMEVFLCEEGLARFCTEEYQKPCTGNLHKIMAHLTNYSLNKRSEKFLHCEEEGSKRLWSQVLTMFSADDRECIQEQIYSMVQTIMCVLKPGMHASWNANFPPGRYTRCPCFQILGIDVLIDESMKCHLMEVNNGPSLGIDMVVPVEPKPVPVDTKAVPVDPKAKVKQQARATISQESKVRGSISHDASDGPCMCMDHHLPHVHQRCAVDQYVKTMVVKGTFVALSEGGTPANFIPVNLRDSPLYNVQSRVVRVFDRIGPASQHRRDKGLGSLSIRKIFGTIAARQDLDLLSVKIKNETKFKKDNSKNQGPCTLWIYELLTIVQYISKLSCIPVENIWESLDSTQTYTLLRRCASLQSYGSPISLSGERLPTIKSTAHLMGAQLSVLPVI